VQNAKGGDNYNTMKNLSHSDILAEEKIRSHIRNRIRERLSQDLISENKIRNAIRSLVEAEAGTEEPSTYTGINVLASLLEKIIPIIEDDYKMLTTSDEQRESFKNHITHAIRNSLKPIDVSTQAEKLPENFVFNVNLSQLAEELKINLDPQTDGEEESSVSGEFIDIAGDDDSDTSDFVEIEDQNETGRNFAATTYKKVEKQIVDAYDMLADEEDQKLFYDYLLTNMMLYFDKFEDELQNSLPSITTPEYEEEKEESEAEPSADDSETETDDSEIDDLLS
jgi:hypothetical protein